MNVRPFDPGRPGDTAAVLDICVRTGDAGRDATGRHPDARTLTDRYAAPYLALEPAWAWVAEAEREGEGDGPTEADAQAEDDGEADTPGPVVGYIVGTPDTRAFAERLASWPSSLTDAERQAHADWLRSALTPEELDAYPAHLHIDLLPAAQGRGAGRTLIETFTGRLAAAGVPGVHLVVDPANTGAQAFYPRVGFERRRELADGVLFVRPTG